MHHPSKDRRHLSVYFCKTVQVGSIHYNLCQPGRFKTVYFLCQNQRKAKNWFQVNKDFPSRPVLTAILTQGVTQQLISYLIQVPVFAHRNPVTGCHNDQFSGHPFTLWFPWLRFHPVLRGSEPTSNHNSKTNNSKTNHTTADHTTTNNPTTNDSTANNSSAPAR